MRFELVEGLASAREALATLDALRALIGRKVPFNVDGWDTVEQRAVGRGVTVEIVNVSLDRETLVVFVEIEVDAAGNMAAALAEMLVYDHLDVTVRRQPGTLTGRFRKAMRRPASRPGDPRNELHRTAGLGHLAEGEQDQIGGDDQ